MDPVKALTRAGLFSGLVNKFDGGVEILDDVDDHWTAKHHKTERTLLIEDLQDLAAEKSVRITILGYALLISRIDIYINTNLITVATSISLPSANSTQIQLLESPKTRITAICQMSFHPRS